MAAAMALPLLPGSRLHRQAPQLPQERLLLQARKGPLVSSPRSPPAISLAHRQVATPPRMPAAFNRLSQLPANPADVVTVWDVNPAQLAI